MNALEIEEAIVELIRVNSSSLAEDVVEAIEAASENEEENSEARSIFNDIKENLLLSEKNSLPVCQDTGYPIFYVYFKKDEHSALELKRLIHNAVEVATAKSYLRRNCIDSVTGKAVFTNVLDIMPKIHFVPIFEGPLSIKLLQKGGGSENVSAQYALPNSSINAHRDLNGVYLAVMDSILKAEGKGCAPGFLGICIGGDREGGWQKAKEELFKRCKTRNPNKLLGELEERILHDANKLGIGPMGLGGKSTILNVSVTSAPRLPACFYVTISYNCWALRRRTLSFLEGGYTIV